MHFRHVPHTFQIVSYMCSGHVSHWAIKGVALVYVSSFIAWFCACTDAFCACSTRVSDACEPYVPLCMGGSQAAQVLHITGSTLHFLGPLAIHTSSLGYSWCHGSPVVSCVCLSSLVVLDKDLSCWFAIISECFKHQWPITRPISPLHLPNSFYLKYTLALLPPPPPPMVKLAWYSQAAANLV